MDILKMRSGLFEELGEFVGREAFSISILCCVCL
jgi:hypothetical protein